MISWQWVGIIAAILVLLFAIFKKTLTGKKYVGGHTVGSFSIKKRIIAFGTPSRVELILVALFILFLLWTDILFNALIDGGINHRVQWFQGVTSSAWGLSILTLIAFHITLVTLFLMSLKSKKTNRIYDLVVGVAALFGIAVLLSGFFAQLYGFTVPIFGADLNGTSYYHLGIITEIFTVLYYISTS